jgi:hypothetical protein
LEKTFMMTHLQIVEKAAELRKEVAALRRTKVSIWNPQPLADRLADLADQTLILILQLAAKGNDWDTVPGEAAPREDKKHGDS